MAQAASGFNPVTEGRQIVYDNCHWVAAACSDGEVVLANRASYTNARYSSDANNGRNAGHSRPNITMQIIVLKLL